MRSATMATDVARTGLMTELISGARLAVAPWQDWQFRRIGQRHAGLPHQWRCLKDPSASEKTIGGAGPKCPVFPCWFFEITIQLVEPAAPGNACNRNVARPAIDRDLIPPQQYRQSSHNPAPVNLVSRHKKTGSDRPKRLSFAVDS